MSEKLNKVLLVVNTHSGRGITNQKLGRIITKFSEGGNAIVSVHLTQPGQVRQFTETHAHSFNTVVAIGGDGTFSDVAAGVSCLPEETRPVIGYIPAGTAIDIATTLALSRNADEAIDVILAGKTIALDLGHILTTDQLFTYITAFGAFTKASYATPQDVKKVWGHLAYVVSGAQEVFSIKSRRLYVEYDDGAIEGDFVFGSITNSLSVAGLVKLHPDDVNLSDGLFEIILVKQPINPADFLDIINSVQKKSFHTDQIQMLRTSRASFTFAEPVDFTRDGEFAGSFSQLVVENKHNAVRVIVPESPDTQD
ncbi:MAG: YegS/Rv2252/BmrU family lipid kinase [Oscillospiraceae bacterium]|jgi:YegS/Rv2252/BmrU family lipid kinase|nr:YegS/Rv2252/BmrU family lipid kinase [Oscillospiraceae bacterium]